jgi:hypothetical protein
MTMEGTDLVIRVDTLQRLANIGDPKPARFVRGVLQPQEFYKQAPIGSSGGFAKFNGLEVSVNVGTYQPG